MTRRRGVEVVTRRERNREEGRSEDYRYDVSRFPDLRTFLSRRTIDVLTN